MEMKLLESDGVQENEFLLAVTVDPAEQLKHGGTGLYYKPCARGDKNMTQW
jgi:hypothetical protein